MSSLRGPSGRRSVKRWCARITRTAAARQSTERSRSFGLRNRPRGSACVAGRHHDRLHLAHLNQKLQTRNQKLTVDNASIARVFAEIGDLLEIKNDNPFRVRAYRTAADTIATLGERLADLSPDARLKLPGIGKDLAGKITELIDTGSLEYHRQLLQEFPPSILDLLRLQGVGPKTVALLYFSLNVKSLDDLEAAARDGRLRELKGMGARKEALILKAIEDRKRYGGRQLLATAHDAVAALVAPLRDAAPRTTRKDAATISITPVGSLRRGCETCGDLDIVAATPASGPGAVSPAFLMAAFTRHPLVERVLVQGDTKSSVLLRGGFQADLRVVPRESEGAALQYFTGSKAHNIALRDRALSRGMKLNEYGLFDKDGRAVAGRTEAGIYKALGLALVPPELRENRGEIAAAEAGALPALIERADLKGDLHSHTTASDGRVDLDAMARAAQAAGLEYLAITDHSRSLTMVNGLDEARALAHAAAIREASRRVPGITLLAGIECEILADGRLDLSDDCLAQLDLVIVSVHSGFTQDEAQMTERILRALENPWVDVLGHATGRRILRRQPYALKIEPVIDAAARLGVALEINGNPERLDLSDVHARLARERGAPIVVTSDAHAEADFGRLRWGIVVARRAWLRRQDVLNTLPLAAFRNRLRRHARTQRAR
jgi:DNA polymerase (family 10)